jgi:hypothetical protein
MAHPRKFVVEVTITVSRHDAFKKFRGRNAWSTACWYEFTWNAWAVASRSQRAQVRIRALALHVPIYIIVACVCIRNFIVSDIIDFKLLHESLVDNPWSFWDDLIYPSTMPDCLEPIAINNVTFKPTMKANAEPFRVCHDALSLVQSNLFVRIDANKKIYRWKR